MEKLILSYFQIKMVGVLTVTREIPIDVPSMRRETYYGPLKENITFQHDVFAIL